MGEKNGSYNADFPAGTTIRIADRAFLEEFKNNWKLHHPLETEQLEFAGTEAVVVSVAYYHGGDELYWLDDIPGVWHEGCLSAVATADKS